MEMSDNDGPKGNSATTIKAAGSGPVKHAAVIEGVVKAIVDSKVMTFTQAAVC